ncbi:MAG: 50S ribosomal protein L21 [Candidatus Eisenbacteria bacterium]|nr:50S ribosomal protein L21 [Candidatus Eisenbacteria bacterium]
MYAIVETGGFQFRVEPGAEIEVPKRIEDVGEKVTLSRVLYWEDEEGSRHVGTPTIESVRAEAEVVGHGRGEKVLVYKFKRRKKYRRLIGSRSHNTRLRILAIERGGSEEPAE